MANHLRAELVLDAMEMAVGQRRPKDVIHHSDQGGAAKGSGCEAVGMAAEGANIRLWRSANDVARLACAHRCGLSATPMTMRWLRASFPRSKLGCSADEGLPPRLRPEWLASAISRAGTTQSGCILAWGIARQSHTKPRCKKCSPTLSP